MNSSDVKALTPRGKDITQNRGLRDLLRNSLTHIQNCKLSIATHALTNLRTVITSRRTYAPTTEKANFLKHFIRGSESDKTPRSVRITHAIGNLETGNDATVLSLLNELHLARYSKMLLNILNSDDFCFDLPTSIDDKARIYSVSVNNIVTAFSTGVPTDIGFSVEKTRTLL